MRIILFGAGASYGSDTHNTPPLGPDLFAALAQWSPTIWGALPAPWPAKFQANFEDAMAELIAAGIFAAPLQWSMAAYFFKCFTVTDASLYVRLLQDLLSIDRNIGFVTLNYDSLLLQAAEKVGVQFRCGNDKRSDSVFPLCLPHGSSVLKCIGVTASHGVAFSGGVSTSGSVSMMHNAQEFDQESASNVLPPVMSYFEPNKFTVSCANFITANRTHFAHLTAGANKIAIVGVNVHPVDRHIWDPIGKAPGDCFYLGGAAGSQKYRTWCTQVGRGGDTVCDRYFADGYAELLAFLTS